MGTENIFRTLSDLENKEALDVSIGALKISERFRTILLKRGISTVSDLIKYWTEIRGFKNWGDKAHVNVTTALNLWYSDITQSIQSTIGAEKQPDGKSAFDQEENFLLPIEVLSLNLRIYNLLKRRKIHTIGELHTEWQKSGSFKKSGATTINQIQAAIDAWSKSGKAKSLRPDASPCATSDMPQFSKNVTKSNGLVQPVQDQTIHEPHLDRHDDLYDIPIEALDLPIRAYNALKRNDIDTVSKITQDFDRVSSIKGVGSTVLNQIRTALNAMQIEDENGRALNVLPDDVSQFSLQERLLITKPIYQLKLPDHICSVLVKNDIYTIAQITATKLDELRSQKILDARMSWEIRKRFQFWLSQNEERKAAYFKILRDDALNVHPDGLGFEEYFCGVLDTLKPTYVSIIETRFGLKTGESKTLKETAGYFAITPERVRQIEVESLKKLRYPFRLHELGQSLFILRMKELIQKRGELISESRLINELQSELRFESYFMGGVIRFISKLFKEEIRIPGSNLKLIYIPVLSGWSTNVCDMQQVLRASRKIVEILADAEFPMQWTDIYSSLIREDGLITLDEYLAHTIAICMNDNQQIHRQLDGGWSKTGKVTRYLQLISVMRQMGQPAHFHEIAELYNQIYQDRPFTPNSVHGLLSSRKEFVRVGRGKFGLAEWGLQNDGNVSNAVRRILAHNQQPMLLADITDEVLKTWDVQKAAIVAAIDNDARFTKTVDGKFWLTETGISQKKRIKREDKSRADRLFSVLQDLGQPLPASEIVDAHNGIHPERPLTVSAAKQLMYRKTKLFTHLGSGCFALAEWGLEASTHASTWDSKAKILNIIKEQGPISFTTLHHLYNETRSERPISEHTLRMCLRNLEDKILSRNIGEYEVNDGSNSLDSAASLQRNHKKLPKLISALNEIGRPAHLNEIAEVYQRLFPIEEIGFVSIRAALYNNKTALKNFGAGIFGLPEWDAPPTVLRAATKSISQTSSASKRESRFSRVVNVFSELKRPARGRVIFEKYNQLYAESPIKITDLYRVLYGYKDSFRKVGNGLYGLSIWGDIDDAELEGVGKRRDRLMATLQSLGVPSKINRIMEKHNELYPEKPLPYATVNEVLYKHKDAFISVGRGTYALISADESK
jgi:hypothetical protein